MNVFICLHICLEFKITPIWTRLYLYIRFHFVKFMNAWQYFTNKNQTWCLNSLNYPLLFLKYLENNYKHYISKTNMTDINNVAYQVIVKTTAEMILFGNKLSEVKGQSWAGCCIHNEPSYGKYSYNFHLLRAILNSRYWLVVLMVVFKNLLLASREWRF